MFGALQLRILAGLYHKVGDFEAQASTLDEMTENYPNLLLFAVDHAIPYAALGDSTKVREIVTRVLGLPGSRAQFDFMVWSVCDVFRAHGYPDMGVDLAAFYLSQRPDEGWDSPLRNNKAVLLSHAGQWEEARTLFESCVADSIRPDISRIQLGALAARRGDAEYARQVINEQIVPWQQEPDGQGSSELWRALFAALSGEFDDAVRWLREASRKGQTPNEGWKHDPDLFPLLGYAPFEELVRPQG